MDKIEKLRSLAQQFVAEGWDRDEILEELKSPIHAPGARIVDYVTLDNVGGKAAKHIEHCPICAYEVMCMIDGREEFTQAAKDFAGRQCRRG